MDEPSDPTLTGFGPDVTWPSDPDETFRPPEESGGSVDPGSLPAGDVADTVARLPVWAADELEVDATAPSWSPSFQASTTCSV